MKTWYFIHRHPRGKHFVAKELAFSVPTDLALATAFVAEKANAPQTVALMSSQLNVVHNELIRWLNYWSYAQNCKGHKTGLYVVFLIDGEQQAVSMTYSELDTQARTIAATLQALGLQGERAVLLYPQGLDYIAAFSLSLCGCYAVPAYPPKNKRTMPACKPLFKTVKPLLF